MVRELFCLCVVACLGLCGCESVRASDANTAEGDKPAITATPVAIGANEIAVTVNGVEITEAQVEAEIPVQLKAMKITVPNSPAEAEKVRKLGRRLAVEALLDRVLLDEELKKKAIVITDEQVLEHLKQMLSQSKRTLEQFKESLQRQGMTLEQWMKHRQMHKALAYSKLFEAWYAGKIDVTEDDARELYDARPEGFTRQQEVRASHILIKPKKADEGTDPNQAKAKAKAKTEDLLKQIKAGADFAELAKAYSQHLSSAQKGGDLGFFPRAGHVAPRFGEAAFALEVGQVSSVVETRFGYHIIKVTDRREGGPLSFPEVKDKIIQALTQQKRRQLAAEYIKSLKAEANIVYPPGKEPPEPTDLSCKPADDSEPNRDPNEQGSTK